MNCLDSVLVQKGTRVKNRNQRMALCVVDADAAGDRVFLGIARDFYSLMKAPGS